MLGKLYIYKNDCGRETFPLGYILGYGLENLVWFLVIFCSNSPKITLSLLYFVLYVTVESYAHPSDQGSSLEMRLCSKFRVIRFGMVFGLFCQKLLSNFSNMTNLATLLSYKTKTKFRFCKFLQYAFLGSGSQNIYINRDIILMYAILCHLEYFKF